MDKEIKHLENILSKYEGMKCLQCGYAVISDKPEVSQITHHRDWCDHAFDKAKSEREYWLTESTLKQIDFQARQDSLEKVKKIVEEIKVMEERANFFYEDADDLTNKTYERGFYDGIHNCIAKLSQLEKPDTYGAYDDGVILFKFETNEQRMQRLIKEEKSN